MARRDTLFVYGSLLAGAGHPMHAQLAAAATRLGGGHVYGQLYDLGEYPGLVLADDPASSVAGELYRIHDDQLWDALDAYEGCGPVDPTPWEFTPAPCRVHTDLGTLTASVYIYTHHLHHARLIPHGDWLTHLTTRP